MGIVLLFAFVLIVTDDTLEFASVESRTVTAVITPYTPLSDGPVPLGKPASVEVLHITASPTTNLNPSAALCVPLDV